MPVDVLRPPSQAPAQLSELGETRPGDAVHGPHALRLHDGSDLRGATLKPPERRLAFIPQRLVVQVFRVANRLLPTRGHAEDRTDRSPPAATFNLDCVGGAEPAP